MSVEFRLKYKSIRDVIDKDINEVLLKWNARKVILNEPFDEDKQELCLACIANGKQSYLKYSYVNIDEAVYKCESAACLFPFRNFKYKNFTDRTIFRYERILPTDEPKKKVFTSPTKVENGDDDLFNISWLNHSYTTETDLDTILTTPSDGIDYDIKEIINNICGNVVTPPKNTISPSQQRNEQSPKPAAPTLSKCLEYIQHLSPTKQSFSNKKRFEVKTSAPLSAQVSSDFTPKETTSKFKLPEMLKADIKPTMKNPKVLKKNQEISPIVSFNVDKHPLVIRNRFNVVSKTNTEKMQCEVAQIKEKIENDSSNSSEKSFDSTNQLPILIEIIGTSTSYHLDGNQISNDSEQRSSYNDLQTIQIEHKSTLNPTFHERITSQTTEYISSEEKISTRTDTNLINNSLERSEFDFQIVKSALGTNAAIKDQQKEQTQINEKLIPPSVLQKKIRRKKIEQRKEEVRLQKLALQNLRKEKREHKKQQLERKLLKKKEKKQKKSVELNTNINNLSIDDEDVFHGFETLEPFQPIQLQTKPLIWIDNE